VKSFVNGSINIKSSKAIAKSKDSSLESISLLNRLTKNLAIFAQFAGLFFGLIGFATAHAGSGQLYIYNEAKQPVAGAEVLIGTAPGVPFAGNKLTTDINGSISIPAGWATTLPITITAQGYVNATFLAVPPIANSLQLHKTDSRTAIEVKGDAKEFGTLRRDGKVDFALVYPGLRLQQLNRFDIDSMISSEVDIIRILTEDVALPSNLALPEQKETYILPITLNKPTYRMSFGQAGNYRMTAIHGQFPLSQVVGEIRAGKSVYEVINYFRMIGGGQRDITVNNSIAGQDIAVNQISLSKNVTVKAGPFASDLVMFSFALVNQGELYFPTDIKRVMPNESMNLVVPANSEKNSLISLLTPTSTFDLKYLEEFRPKTLNPADDLVRFVTAMTRFVSEEASTNALEGGISTVRHEVTEATPTFLDLVQKPALAPGKLNLTPPRAIAGIEPVATYAVLTEADNKPKSQFEVERRYRIWELSQLGWATELVIPAEAEVRDPAKKYRWEVLFMGRRSGHSGSGEYFLDGVTHISRNSIDY
jgi:hypothetical protein